MQYLIAGGCSWNDVGHICLSKRNHNSVVSNVIGAAAYYGHKELMEMCINEMSSGKVDLKATETSDRKLAGSKYKPELADFTPLQLALASPTPNVDVVKSLFAHDANHFVKSEKSSNIMHLVAKN